MLDEAEFAAQYDRAYFMGGGPHSNYADYGEDPGWRPLVAVLRAFLPARPAVLEVGCATGWFVKNAREAGWICDGIDVSQWAVENAATPIDWGYAWRLPYADAQYDAVVSFEFLEHVPPERIALVLAEMQRVVKPGGLMLHKIGMDLEGDESWDQYPQYEHDDGTHVLMRPRWWWEQVFASFSAPHRRLERSMDLLFTDRDWWGRWYGRRMGQESSPVVEPVLMGFV
jgi:SAM-dependent methyltransferase